MGRRRKSGRGGPPEPAQEVSPVSRSEASSLLLPLSLVVFPVLALLFVVARLGVNVAFADELHYSEFLRLFHDGGDWRAWLFAQHNEHRVVSLKLLILALSWATRWNQKVEMFCSVGLTALLIWILWRTFRAVVGGNGSERARLLYAFAPVAWLACSVSQYESQLYGLMVCHYFTAAGSVVALCLLGRSGVRSLVGGCAAAVVAATSIASGLLVFPAGVVVLAVQRATWRKWLAWCVTGVVTTVLYFRHYLSPGHARPFGWSVADFLGAARLTLSTAGAPIAGGSVAWGIVAGAALLAVAGVLLWRWWRSENDFRAAVAPLAAILLLGMVNAVTVGVGRSVLLNPGSPLGPRYITHTNLAWYGVVLLTVFERQLGVAAKWRAAVCSVLVLGLAASNLWGLHEALSWHRERILDQYVVQTYSLHSDKTLSRLGDPKIFRPRLELLERMRLSAFASPQQLIMLMTTAGGVATAFAEPDRPVVQRLTCPVEDLHDLAVLVMAPDRPSPDRPRIVVRRDGVEVARRNVAVGAIKGWTWVGLPLAKTVPCRGHELTVAIEAEQTTAGGGLRGLAAEPYYAGELTQGGTEVPNRRLALALNAYRLGVLK